MEQTFTCVLILRTKNAVRYFGNRLYIAFVSFQKILQTTTKTRTTERSNRSNFFSNQQLKNPSFQPDDLFLLALTPDQPFFNHQDKLQLLLAFDKKRKEP